jgi:Ser/Thr protein kinase RdoA (MazF antagonist)
MRRFDELTDDEKVEKLLRLAQKALQAYGLAGELSFAAQGACTVFRLRAAGTSYALHVSAAGRDLTPLRRELLWLAALGRDTALVVPEPVITLTGDLFRSTSMEGVPGTRACTVRRWIDGERREAELRTEEAAAVGQFVAALHRHAEAFSWPEELAMTYRDPASRALIAADTIREALTAPDDRARLCDAVSFIAEATATLGDSPDAVGIIHGDLRLRKLRHGAESVGALGFDECRAGAYLDDLSVVWAELAGREATAALQGALVDGYRSLRDVRGVPEAALRAFILLRVVESIAQAASEARIHRRPSAPESARLASAFRGILSGTHPPAGDAGTQSP